MHNYHIKHLKEAEHYIRWQIIYNEAPVLTWWCFISLQGHSIIDFQYGIPHSNEPFCIPHPFQQPLQLRQHLPDQLIDGLPSIKILENNVVKNCSAPFLTCDTLRLDTVILTPPCTWFENAKIKSTGWKGDMTLKESSSLVIWLHEQWGERLDAHPAALH